MPCGSALLHRPASLPPWKHSSLGGVTSGRCCFLRCAHTSSISGGLHSSTWCFSPLRPSSSPLDCPHWLLQWLCLCLALAPCLTMPLVPGAPASCGSPHQAHWSPFQCFSKYDCGRYQPLSPEGWVPRSCLSSLTHGGPTACSIFPWEYIHCLLLSFVTLQSWSGTVSVFLPCGSEGAPEEKSVTGSVPSASACSGRQVSWTAE